MNSFDYVVSSLFLWLAAVKFSLEGLEAAQDQKWLHALFIAFAVFGAARLGWLLWSMS